MEVEGEGGRCVWWWWWWWWWCVVVVVVVVVRTFVLHEGVCPATRTHAPNWVAEHLGASSRRPRHPFPALMAGVTQAVYLCTRPKKAFPSRHEQQLRRNSAVICTTGPHALS